MRARTGRLLHSHLPLHIRKGAPGALIAGILILGLSAAVVVPGTAEVLTLGGSGGESGPDRLCLTGPGARYSWTEEALPRLRPEAGLFSFYDEGQLPLWPVADLPQEVPKGEAIRGLLVLPEALEGLEARLESGGGEPEAEARGFAIDPGRRTWAVLLGVASTAEAGGRSLVLHGWSGGREFELHAPLRILHREFQSESIAFDQPLSELMTTPDPRKEEEYRVLRELLEGHDEAAVHHLGPLIVPVAALRRTSRFADRRHYRYADGGSSRSLHNGVDLAAPVGTPVTASGDGRVVLAVGRLLTGLTIVLEHLPGVYTLYYHLDSLAVEAGESVSQGQRIGTVGMTGLATGPHLHWELRVAGIPVDPDSLVGEPLIDQERLSMIIRALSQDGYGAEPFDPAQGW